MNPTNERDTVHGPYDTSGEALRDAAHVYDASRRQERRGTMSQISEGLLLAALASAGVQLGEFERGIAGWLAGYEPETVLVVIGWIERARSAENLAVNWAHHVAAQREPVPAPASPDLVKTLDAAIINALDLSLATADPAVCAQIGDWVAKARAAQAAGDAAEIRRLLAAPYTAPGGA